MESIKVGRGHKRASDEEIIEAYRKTGSVWKAAKLLGLVGQTVHERLVRLDHPLAHAAWTDEENKELQRLLSDPHLTIADIAKRLNRTSASISCRANELGFKKARKNSKPIPRGKGYDKISIKRHLKKLEEYPNSLTKYCRANSLSVESFTRAIQKNFPDWWDKYLELNSDLEQKICPYCKDPFYPNSGKQQFCTRTCGDHARRDQAYFGGKKRAGKGVQERICQLCFKDIEKGMHVHHIYGKKNDPENEFLIALCRGCHLVVEQISIRNFAEDDEAWKRLIELVWKKRNGWRDENEGKSLKVFITQEVI